MKNVMVDLETFGNGSRAVIVAIGAVEFGPDGLGREFYSVVDPQSCIDCGLTMDASTILWWLKQSEEARNAITQQPGRTLSSALLDFTNWYPSGAALWGNGASFDNVILTSAYKATFLKQPWSYQADRCYRTLKNLRPDIKLVRSGTHHNALDDAKTQAEHAIRLLADLGNT